MLTRHKRSLGFHDNRQRRGLGEASNSDNPPHGVRHPPLPLQNPLQLLRSDSQFERQVPEHLHGRLLFAPNECQHLVLPPAVPLCHLRQAGAVGSLGAASGNEAYQVWESHAGECTADRQNYTFARCGGVLHVFINVQRCVWEAPAGFEPATSASDGLPPPHALGSDAGELACGALSN